MATKKATKKTDTTGAEKKRPKAKGKSSTISSPVMRASFPFVHKADSSGEYSKGDYNITCFLPKEREGELKALKQACLQAAKQDWPKIKFNDLEHPFRDGSEEGNERYEDAVFFRAKTTRKPTVVGPDLQQLPEGVEVYGGCYVRVSVVAASYYRPGEVIVEKDGKRKKTKQQIKGVTLYLNNVQFVKDGERLGGGSDPNEDFDEIDPSEYDDIEEGEGFDEDDGDEEEGDEEEIDEEI